MRGQVPMSWQSIAIHDLGDPSIIPGIASCYRWHLGASGRYVVLFVCLWLSFALLFRAFGPRPGAAGNAKLGTWALKSTMLVHHVVITPLALAAMWHDDSIWRFFSCFGCAESALTMLRSDTPAMAARALAPVTLGYFGADLLLLSQWQLVKGGSLEFTLTVMHHVASLALWPLAICFDYTARYLILFLFYEFSSILHVAIWMLSAAGHKSSALYKLAGFFFTLSFVCIRLLGAIPQLRALVSSPPWTRDSELAVSGPGGVHDWAWISASLLLPHLLNFFWGAKVIRGAYLMALQSLALRSKAE